MENMQWKNFMPYIEIVNKLSLKEHFRPSIMKTSMGPGD